MTDTRTKPMACFGDLETVFPMGKDGLRVSPDTCFDCEHKTDCLKKALSNRTAYARTRSELIDRSYASGTMSFWERWARKKNLKKKQKNPNNSSLQD